MKTQISRDSFRPGERYSGVYLQQGRMILDADWNELTDIQKVRLVEALRDAIASGAPRNDGLRIYADTATPDTILIQPGMLYVDGVPARLDGDTPLHIDQQPDYPFPGPYSGQNLTLYADVWERSVTALERSALMDAALHGADTATRSQTMLQVKWCDHGVDPFVEATNPTIGTAPLTLTLRQVASGGDPCDPCASQVKVNERIGNYLFRVEVHDYKPNTRELTLKWSSDNGAEACRVDAMPNGFDQGDWVWEFFDDDTERLLGNHFPLEPHGPLKLRGLIRADCTAPTGTNDPKTYVRQWDGALTINLDTHAIVTTGASPYRDHGVALYSGALDDEAHGRLNVSTTGGHTLNLNLERMELTLAIDSGRLFVPGDYWIAEVREASDQSGDEVLTAAVPRGVHHHYLKLGELNIAKKLVAVDDAFRRRMGFPPLTNITALDVGFTDHCPGLFAGAENVQQALDNLCAIGADDIAYLLPNCGTDEGKSIKDRLKALLDPNNDGKLTVRDALDNLLCKLNAGTLPYAVPDCVGTTSVGKLLGLSAGDGNVGPMLDKLLCNLNAAGLPLDKSDDKLCSDLQVPAVVTVQDALRIVCDKAGAACAVMATSPEHLGVLLSDFAKSATATDLWVCLKAGNYPIADLSAISGKHSLRISGESAGSVSITFSGAAFSVDADAVILENVTLKFNNGVGRLAVTAATMDVHGCGFSRTSGNAARGDMIVVDGRGGNGCRLSWRDNSLSARYAQVIGDGGNWAGPSVVGVAAVSDAILALGSEQALASQSSYDAALNKAADAVMSMSAKQRQAWKTALDKIPAKASAKAATPGTAAAKTKTTTTTTTTSPNPAVAAVPRMYSTANIPQATISGISNILADAGASRAATINAVEQMVAQWVTYWPDYALRLNDKTVGGTIEQCNMYGWLLLGNGVDGHVIPPTLTVVSIDGPAVNMGGTDLRISDSNLTGVRANLPANVHKLGELVFSVNGYGQLTLSGNNFESTGNVLVASNVIIQGNYWLGNGVNLGSVVCDRAVVTGNLVEDSAKSSVLNITAVTQQLAASGNLLLNAYVIRK